MYQPTCKLYLYSSQLFSYKLHFHNNPKCVQFDDLHSLFVLLLRAIHVVIYQLCILKSQFLKSEVPHIALKTTYQF